MRINRFLALCGMGSRREVESLVLEGRVTLRGLGGISPISSLSTQVDAEWAEVFVDGERVRPRKKRFILLYKPVGVVTTKKDPLRRPIVMDLLRKTDRDLFPVGRLDIDSEGLLLFTNDGELAQRIAHPKHGLTKRYEVEVIGSVHKEILDRMKAGIRDEGEMLKVREARQVRKHGKKTTISLVLGRGKKREIRRLCKRLGLKVLRLKRVAIGPLEDPWLERGRCRPLKDAEIEALRLSLNPKQR
ncbi:rRNA pseudouridine synthase [bacterium]|nr:rRNA pseudouridine synthase [bacterium]